MKRILIRFYSVENLGDDLFIHTLAQYFSDCKIALLSSIKHQPRNLPANTRLHPLSYILAVIGMLEHLASGNPSCMRKLWSFAEHCRARAIQKNDAYVYLGGSLFMQSGQPHEEIDFSVGSRPVFDYVSHPQDKGKMFLIGANLGPVYQDSYWNDIRKQFMDYRHVCLRDYSSYSMIKDLFHVQYAPDVIFLTPQPEPVDVGENVVISVVDIGARSKNHAVVTAYYELLRDTVEKFNARNIPVTLVSFCRFEGDEQAIDHLLEMVSDDTNVSTCLYNNNIQEILSLFSSASYIVASRFHAVILALSFGKPVFPISYNCKTKHYLEDVGFQGRYATLEELPDTTLEDVLHNYDNRIITDCTQHKKYAKNQFRALREYLDR